MRAFHTITAQSFFYCYLYDNSSLPVLYHPTRGHAIQVGGSFPDRLLTKWAPGMPSEPVARIANIKLKKKHNE